MSPEEITRNREAFESCCHQYIQRNGIDALLEYLKTKTDFFEAPSSTSFISTSRGDFAATRSTCSRRS